MKISIRGRDIGPGYPLFIVAELSGNHNGDLQRAIATVRAAAEAGADAIKLQTYTADTLTIDCRSEHFVIPGDGPWGGRNLYDLYRDAHTPWDWHLRLFEEARSCGIEIFSTPFDDTAVVFLEELGCPAYKIASFELLDDALLTSVGGTGKPVLLSTGMASLEEIAHALGTLRAAGCREILLLRCTSSYPAPDASMNLLTLPLLSQTMDCPVGLSDHSLGVVAPIVAVALGACFIEKHLTLRRADGGVDSHFSLEPTEFRTMAANVRRAEAMLGAPAFGPGIAEESSRIFRRSLFVVRDVMAGEEFSRENVRSIRPGFGLAPRFLEVVLGKRAARGISRGTPFTWDLIGGG
jgi:pseudaminic acid synthase